MPRRTSFDRVCCPRAVMSCHARRRQTVCAVQGRLCHATLDIADRVCYPRAVMSCHAQRLPTVHAVQGRLCEATHNVIKPYVHFKGGDGMPYPSSSDRVCCPKAVMSWDTRRSPIVCTAQGR